MFKRREFKVLHGDGDDSSSSDSEPQASGSAEQSESEPDDFVGRTGGRLARLEDISDKEDDSDADGAAPDVTGPPWKCAICPQVLLLTQETLTQHVLSKRHARAQKRQQPGLPDPVYPAKGVFPAGYVNPDESDGETHAERLVRVRDEHLRKTAAVAPAAAKDRSKGRQRQRNRKRKAAAEKPASAVGKATRAPKRALKDKAAA